MLDLLASIFVGTNYARKFVIFKGKTKNGKSKLCQLVTRAFGRQCMTIRPDNIRPGSSVGGPNPELASTLFCCRAVVLDEIGGRLNENIVKEITGNSNVSFRNLFESNIGGVPLAKIFCSTNSVPACTTTEAFQDRVVAIPFRASFDTSAPSTTSEQLIENVYPLETDDCLVENAHVGLYLILHHHFMRHSRRLTTNSFRPFDSIFDCESSGMRGRVGR
jgi:phage/plasmid-associated DNA primase